MEYSLTCMVLVKKAENTSSIILLMFPTRGNEINIGHSPQALESSGNICRVFLLLIIGASQFHHDLKKKPIKNRFRAPLSPLRALSHRYLLDHLPQAPPVEEASCLQQQTQPKAQRKKPQSWGLVTQGGYCKMAWISLTCMGKKLIKHSCDFRFKLF